MKLLPHPRNYKGENYEEVDETTTDDGGKHR